MEGESVLRQRRHSNADESEEDEQPRPMKVAPVEPGDDEVQGKSSVNPATMAAAARIGDLAKSVLEDVGEAVGTVAAHHIHTSSLDATSKKPSSRPSSSTSFVSSDALPASKSTLLRAHSSALKSGGSTGRSIGGRVGETLAKFGTHMAARLGAHRCDGCGLKPIYNYYICEHPKCVSDSATEEFNLCVECHDKYRRGGNLLQSHPPNHRMREYNNGEYAGKRLFVAIGALIFLRLIGLV